MPTTRKETRRVVPKREVVRRDRGWRWGVMVGTIGGLLKSWEGQGAAIASGRRTARRKGQ